MLEYSIMGTISITNLEVADSFFDAPTFAKKANKALLMFELLTFHSVVLDEEAAKPLTWWKDQANRFPNVGLANSWNTLFLD
jgi:hypothetical protein